MLQHGLSCCRLSCTFSGSAKCFGRLPRLVRLESDLPPILPLAYSLTQALESAYGELLELEPVTQATVMSLTSEGVVNVGDAASSTITELSGTLTVPGCTLAGQKVQLAFQLPLAYPLQASPQVTVFCSGERLFFLPDLKLCTCAMPWAPLVYPQAAAAADAAIPLLRCSYTKAPPCNSLMPVSPDMQAGALPVGSSSGCLHRGRSRGLHAHVSGAGPQGSCGAAAS